MRNPSTLSTSASNRWSEYASWMLSGLPEEATIPAGQGTEEQQSRSGLPCGPAGSAAKIMKRKDTQMIVLWGHLRFPATS